MTETSKHDPGWWLHCLGACLLSLLILAMYHWQMETAWVPSILFALVWPGREFVQNQLGMFKGRSLLEWWPATLITIVAMLVGMFLL